MSGLIPSALLQRLSRSRLVGRSAEARHGVGDRRSKAVGPGIEFADYREYQPGDDFRYLDRHVYARHGRAVVRQYTVEQRLQVTVIVDASASMGIGRPPKMRRAAELAGVVAAVAVSGNDQVDLIASVRGGLLRHPRHASRRGTERALAWLAALAPAGITNLDAVSRATADRLQPGGMLVVVSDWMVDGIEAALTRWRGRGLDLVAVQVVADDEADPRGALGGPIELVDAETGGRLEFVLDDVGAGRYAAAFRAWQHEVRDVVTTQGARWSAVRSGEDLSDVVLRRWRTGGLVT
jgi:uncharacterized protein (DUF58 family)